MVGLHSRIGFHFEHRENGGIVRLRIPTKDFREFDPPYVNNPDSLLETRVFSLTALVEPVNRLSM